MFETVARVPAPESVVHIAKEDLGKVPSDAAPAGLIFHVARCGSTLLSQSLKTFENLVVYSEPLPVNEILLPPHKWPRHELVLALRSLGAAFARHARKPYVLKFSSWNTLYCDILAEAFPASPWILSLRDPIEVGVSILNDLPGWLKDTADLTRHLSKFVEPDGPSKSREEYVARLYGAFCDAAGRLDAKRGKLVPYAALPAAVWEIVAPHFSLRVDDRQRQLIAQSARINAKAPIAKPLEFASDIATKQAAASAELRRAVDLFARPHLERLKARHRQ
ncbi:MAG: hypothetical protein ABL996_06260 [Micropepsaceae bacterium]